MNIEINFHSLFDKLKIEERVFISIYGLNLEISLMNDGTKLFLRSEIYKSWNFIPKSVRNSLNKPPYEKTSRFSSLPIIDEENFSIYLVSWQPFDEDLEAFQSLIEEFCWAACEWRHYLNEQGRQDLVHVLAK